MFVTIYCFTECIRQRKNFVVHPLPNYMIPLQTDAWTARINAGESIETPCLDYICRSCPHHSPRVNEPRILVPFRGKDGVLRKTYVYTAADLFSIGCGKVVLDPITGDVYCGRKPPQCDIWSNPSPIVNGDNVLSYLTPDGRMLPPYVAPTLFPQENQPLNSKMKRLMRAADDDLSGLDDDESLDDDASEGEVKEDANEVEEVEFTPVELDARIHNKRATIPAMTIKPLLINPCHETKMMQVHMIGQIYYYNGTTYGICCRCAMRATFCLSKFVNGMFVCGACTQRSGPTPRHCAYCAMQINAPDSPLKLWTVEGKFVSAWFCKAHTLPHNHSITRLTEALAIVHRRHVQRATNNKYANALHDHN